MVTKEYAKVMKLGDEAEQLLREIRGDLRGDARAVAHQAEGERLYNPSDALEAAKAVTNTKRIVEFYEKPQGQIYTH